MTNLKADSESDKDLPRDILGFRTITSILALLGAPKVEIDDHVTVKEPEGLNVLNSLATLLVRNHEIVAVVVDEESIPKKDTVNVIVCLEGKDTLTFGPQYVLPDNHIATANPRDPDKNLMKDSLTHIGNIEEPTLLEETKVDIQLSNPWPHISATW